MLQHELMRGRLLSAIQPACLLLLLAAVGLASWRWYEVDAFLRPGRPGEGTVLSVSPGGTAAIALPPWAGGRLDAADGDGLATGATVPVVVRTAPGDGTEARLATAHALWAPFWRAVEAALAFGLLAVFGRAVIEDPMSVIGFRSWRLFRRDRDTGKRS